MLRDSRGGLGRGKQEGDDSHEDHGRPGGWKPEAEGGGTPNLREAEEAENALIQEEAESSRWM